MKFAYFCKKVYFIFRKSGRLSGAGASVAEAIGRAQQNMIGKIFQTIQKAIPAAMLIVLYAAGAVMRPVIGPEEYRNWLAVPADAGCFAVIWEWAAACGNVRFAPVAAALAGVAAVWWFVRLHRPVLAEPAAVLTAITGLWYFCGTSATVLMFWSAALVWAVLGCSAVVTARGTGRIVAAALAVAGIAGVIAGWPVLLRLEDFRQVEMMPLLVIGSLPLLLLVSPVYGGWRQVDMRSPLTRTALAGVVLSLAAAWLGPAGLPAMVPFLAVIWVLSLEQVLAEPEGVARFNRVLRNWLVVVLLAAMLIFGLQLGVRLKLLGGDWRLYRQPGKYVMAILIAGITVGWWRFAIREERPWQKLRAFAVGFSILLLAAPTLLTDRTLERIAPAEALRRVVPHDGMIAAESGLLPVLRYLGVPSDRLLDIGGITDPAGAVQQGSAAGPFTVITRQMLPPAFPPPARRVRLISSGIRIWEYDRR